MRIDESQRPALIAALQRELLTHPEVVFAFLHGSFPSGGPFRDIDVAVWLDPSRVARGDRDRYALDLSVDLHLKLGLPVDVRALNDASLAFRHHALEGEPVVVGDLRDSVRQLREVGEAKVDDGEVYRVIRENLGDFDGYLASIGRYLSAELE